MPLRSGSVLLLAMLVLASVGCSRLTFVKPKMERGKYTQVAPDYQVREDAKDQKSIAAMNAEAMAAQQLQHGQLDEAERQARLAVEADPKAADAHTMLAVVLQQRGSSKAAGVEYEKAVALAPQSGTVLNNYAAWLCGNGRAAESLPVFDRALADPSYPTPATALANAGACALLAGQPAYADPRLRRALEFDPDNAVALAALAETEFRAGRYLEARAFSERRLAAAPPTPEVLQLASQIEQKLGDTAAAARYVQRIRAEFPRNQTVPPGETGQ